MKRVKKFKNKPKKVQQTNKIKQIKQIMIKM